MYNVIVLTFRPAGWDNENKIAFLDDHLRTIQVDKSYNAVIMRPAFMKPKVEELIDCDEDQLFLIDVEVGIEKTEKTPHRPPGAPSTHNQPNLSKGPASSRTPSKGPPDTNSNREPGDTMISQFFNALLHKKGTSPNNVSQNSSTTSAPNVSQTQS
ncbi:Cytoplasmic dynein 1 light intermediate chain 2 isoform X2 [Oopsacas minuta]|uniref:Dynein light intermediate chain n=1 Tax=Oopsacas minuta TaxID=111878 RepID=A0AAV7JYU0_9METZ|nr:Cytoplasmic dynein 1 light intermediate chain 2 isoform X2 [Oopsacas minuta]